MNWTPSSRRRRRRGKPPEQAASRPAECPRITGEQQHARRRRDLWLPAPRHPLCPHRPTPRKDDSTADTSLPARPYPSDSEPRSAPALSEPEVLSLSLGGASAAARLTAARRKPGCVSQRATALARTAGFGAFSVSEGTGAGPPRPPLEPPPRRVPRPPSPTRRRTARRSAPPWHPPRRNPGTERGWRYGRRTGTARAPTGLHPRGPPTDDYRRGMTARLRKRSRFGNAAEPAVWTEPATFSGSRRSSRPLRRLVNSR